MVPDDIPIGADFGFWLRRMATPTTVSGVRTPFATIMADVARKHQVGVDELRSSCRTQRLFWARAEIVWRARRETKLSYPQIGVRLGGRDHTTMVSAHRRYSDFLVGRVGVEA